MMRIYNSEWPSYNQLAWTEPIMAPPEDCADETVALAEMINAVSPAKTLLHLGCGAGANDFTFKRYFEVTGIDISPEMLRIAGEINQEVVYLHGDMRDFELETTFDAVVIPDCIDYILTRGDLEATVENARRHLKPGGTLLIVANPEEKFSNNNFAYTGSREDTHITIFENNHLLPDRSGYQATIVYLIRQMEKLDIHSETHLLGLFSSAVWISIFENAGFELNIVEMNHNYDRFILNQGQYRQAAFIGKVRTR